MPSLVNCIASSAIIDHLQNTVTQPTVCTHESTLPNLAEQVRLAITIAYSATIDKGQLAE